MLLELKIQNLGIIDDIDWHLEPGLNVITGETGAGKSLIIDAVELLLTGSAGEEVIRYGASEARVEGVFHIGEERRFDTLKTLMAEKGIPVEDDTLIIACEIRKQKPGVVRINGHTTIKSVLRQIGQLLIDIHGQSEHLSLLDKNFHLDFLDAYGHNLDLRRQMGDKVAELRQMENELSSLRNREQESVRQQEFLQYQIDEIKKAQLKESEDEELEKEAHIIAHSEKLKSYSHLAYQALNENEAGTTREPSSVLSKLNAAVQALRKLNDLDPALNQQLEYLDKTRYGLEEVARDIHDYGEGLDFDPARLSEIEERLELIRSLKRKYGKTIPEILEYYAQTSDSLTSLENSAERQQQLQKQLDRLRSETVMLAQELSRRRREAASNLEADVKKEIHDLDMGQMQFAVEIKQTPDSHGLPVSGEEKIAFTSNGIDQVEFFASTNPGDPPRPLSKIASTGEISRFTLALKGALSEADNIPVLIFDEVDIGVGGRSGDIIGKKLWSLSRNHQVICVTHLPQIAVYSSAHYCVHKQVVRDRTSSILEKLDNDAQLKELAQMLFGPGYSASSLQNAAELLQKATDWKQNAGQSIR